MYFWNIQLFCIHLITLMHAVCLAHLISLDFITLITLMMEIASAFDISVNLYKTTWNIIEDSHLHNHHHENLVSHPNNVWWRVKLWSTSLQNVLQPNFIFSILGPDILLWTHFSETLNTCSTIKVRNLASHSHRQIRLGYSFLNIHLCIFRYEARLMVTNIP